MLLPTDTCDVQAEIHQEQHQEMKAMMPRWRRVLTFALSIAIKRLRNKELKHIDAWVIHYSQHLIIRKHTSCCNSPSLSAAGCA